MKNLLTSTLLTVVAVPFLSAAPHAAKTQNSTANSTTQTVSTAKKGNKHITKTKKTVKSDSKAVTAPAAKQ